MTKKSEYMRMLLIGQQMSNLCFNLAQSDKIPAEHRATMKELYQEWDAAYPKRTSPGVPCRSRGDSVAAAKG